MLLACCCLFFLFTFLLLPINLTRMQPILGHVLWQTHTHTHRLLLQQSSTREDRLLLSCSLWSRSLKKWRHPTSHSSPSSWPSHYWRFTPPTVKDPSFLAALSTNNLALKSNPIFSSSGGGRNLAP